jgi:hypothetical protein
MNGFVCQTDETGRGLCADLSPKSLRDEVVGLYPLIMLGRKFQIKKLLEIDSLVHYGTTVTWSRKPRTPMDVAKLVTEWTAVAIVLATAHTKEEIDRAEFKMDELLTPLLRAPIAELRVFYSDLTEALRADARVPFFLWSVFNGWGKIVIDKCEAKPERKRLRKKLANEIAEMVDEDVRPDLVKAISGALQWRDPESLEEIKSDLQAGAKPRLKGRESCLFLTTKKPGRNQRQHVVML